MGWPFRKSESPEFHPEPILASWPVIATAAALLVSTLFMLASGLALASLGHDLAELARLQRSAVICGPAQSSTLSTPPATRRQGT